MAKAKRIKQTVREVRKVDRVQLTLTEGEADYLLSMCGFIGGDPEMSPRKYNERIEEALTNALGYRYEQTDAYQLIAKDNLAYHGLIFNDYPEGFEPGDGLKPTAIVTYDGVFDREQWERIRQMGS